MISEERRKQKREARKRWRHANKDKVKANKKKYKLSKKFHTNAAGSNFSINLDNLLSTGN